MNRKISYRLASTKNAPGLAALLMELAREEAGEYEIHPTGAQALCEDLRDAIREFWAEQGQSAYILAFCEGYVIGCIQLTVCPAQAPYDGRVAIFSSLYVMPEHRGHGIAPHLIRQAQEMAKAAEATHYRLFVNEAQKDLGRLYKRFGFKPTYVEMSMRAI